MLSNLERDKKVIQIFDPVKKKILSTLFSHPEVDAEGVSYSKKRKKLLSASYTTWKRGQHFFDTKFKNLIQDIESKIPNKEIRIISKNREETLLIVYAFSDRSPGMYYLYDVKNKKLEKIAETRPWIKEEEMAEMKPISYISRDNLKIHEYLTLPKGGSGKNLPLVVNPHGGPWWRNFWRYNSEVQFLTHLFVIQGAKDPRVHKSESDQIVQALEKQKIEVPYLLKANEGHGFKNEENKMEFCYLMEAFLDKYLKN